MTIETSHLNPFPGLRPFRQDEDYLFFGREEQTMELLERLRDNRFLAIVGTSGSGKSSLVRCGLLSELQGGNMLDAGSFWEIGITHPGGHPMSLLADALLEADLYDGTQSEAKESLLATLTRSQFGLVEAVRQAHLPEGTNFLLIVDQFEELFRFHRAGRTQSEVAREFVSTLLEACAQSEVPIYVVLTMRSDFIGDCSQFENLAEAVNKGEYLIPRLTWDQYKRVIEGPVRVGKGQLTQRLLQRLLNDVRQQPDALPCLQHAMMRTWELWSAGDRSEPIDLKQYQQAGGLSQALSLHADEIYAGLDSDRQRWLCEGLFKALTTQESEQRGIRRPQSFLKLCEIVGSTAAELEPVLHAFRQPGVTFLVPSSETQLHENSIVDISHESLMRVWRRLSDWVHDEAQSVGILRRLAESAALHQQGKAGLYRDPELGIALSWQAQAQPRKTWAEQYINGFDLVIDYLQRSQAAAEQQEREAEAARQRELEQTRQLAETQRMRAEEQRRSAGRLRIGMFALAALALLAVIATFFAVKSSWSANENEALAKEAQADAEREQAAADRLRGEAETNEKRIARELYMADMSRAAQAYEEGSMQRLTSLLERHDGDDGHDQRGPAWRFWKRTTQRAIDEIYIGFGGWNYVAYNPEKQMVAVSNWRQLWIRDAIRFDTIKLFDKGSLRKAAGFETTKSLDEDNWQLKKMPIAFSADGETLAVAITADEIFRFDTETWKQVDAPLPVQQNQDSDVLQARSTYPTQLLYSPDGAYLAGSMSDGRIALWDCDTWQLAQVLETRFDWPGVLVFSPDSRYLTAAVSDSESGSGTLVQWDLPRISEPDSSQSISASGPIRTLCYSPDGRQLLTGHSNGEINVWNGEAIFDTPPERFFTARGLINHVAFSLDGKYFGASTEEGQAILIWDWDTIAPRLVSTLKGQVRARPFIFTEQNQIWACGRDGGAEILDINDGAYSEIPDTQYACGICYVSGKRIAWRDLAQDPPTKPGSWSDQQGRQISGTPAVIQLYDVAKSQLQAPWMGGTEFTIHATSDNGQFLAAQDLEGRIRMWDTEDEKLVATTSPAFRSEAGKTTLLTVSNDGRRVFWVETTGLMQAPWQVERFVLWSPENNGLVHGEGGLLHLGQQEGSTGLDERLAFGAPIDAAFSPDGRRLAVVGWQAFGERVRMIWDISADVPELLHELGGGQGIGSIAFSLDGSRLLSGYRQGYLNIMPLLDSETGWDGERVGSLSHASDVTDLVFLPGGQLLSASLDGVLRMSDINDELPITKLPSKDAALTKLVVDPEGSWLVASTERWNARLFRFQSEDRTTDSEWISVWNHALQGHFKLASELAKSFPSPHPYDRERIYHYMLCALSIQAGDFDTYQWIRNRLMQEIGTTRSPHKVAASALICSLQPGSDAEMRTIDAAASKLQGNHDKYLMFSTFTLEQIGAVARAIANYRLGNYPTALAAIKEFEDSSTLADRGRDVGSSTEDVGHFKSCIQTVRALCEFRQGNERLARQSLSQARVSLRELERAHNYPGTNDKKSDDYWPLWIFEKALLNEAEQLIEGVDRRQAL